MPKENKLSEFMVEYEQGIYISYNKGNWIVENSDFHLGKENCKIKAQGIATTLEVALDNFVYNLSRAKKNNETLENEYV